MSRVGLNSSQGKHLTLNFTVVIKGSRRGDRVWVNGTKDKPSGTVNILEAASECSESRVQASPPQSCGGQANQTVRGIDSEGGKERNNLIMEVKMCINSGCGGVTGVRVQVEDVPGGGEGLSINQSCQERGVAGTHHSFTLRNRSTNSSSKDSTTK